MYRLGLFIGFFLILSCSSFNTQKSDILRNPSSVPGQLDHVDDDTIDQMEAIGDRKILKFSLLKDQAGNFSRLYIQDPKIQFHHQFLTTLPEFKGLNQKQIEALTYKSTPDRKAYIGVFSVEYGWFPDTDRASKTGFYIMSEDLPPMNFLAEARDLLNKAITINTGSADNFIPLPDQEVTASALAIDFKKKNLNLLFEKRSSQQTYSTGWAVGEIKKVANQAELDAAIKNSLITSSTILILGEAVRELPVCAGVISNVPLTPGSHLSLLAQMYGMPLVYEMNAIQKYSNLEGKTIFLAGNTENDKTFQLFDSLSTNEIQLLKSAKVSPELKFEFDPTNNKIVETRVLQESDVKSYGGKAARFGFLQKYIP